MKFGSSKKLYIRRAIFAVLIVLTAAVQHTPGAFPILGRAHAMLLIPLVVSIAMFEKSIAAMLFGVFAGILWDMVSVSADGYFTVVFAFVGFSVSLLMGFVMRNNFPSACVVSIAASLLCTGGYWLIFIALKGYDSPVSLLTSYYLPSAIYTAAMIVIYYFIIKKISALTEPEKKRVNY